MKLLHLLPILMLEVPSFGSDGTSMEILKAELHRAFPQARIEILEDLPTLPADFKPYKAVFLGDNTRGEANFQLHSEAGATLTVRVRFAAWQPVLLTRSKLQVHDRLATEGVRTEEINIASGVGRETRGLYLDPKAEIKRLETRQTILEGQPILTTQVQPVPDLRAGEAVTLRISSGSLIVTTPGILQESVFIGDTARVIPRRTRQEMIGKVFPDKRVEIEL